MFKQTKLIKFTCLHIYLASYPSPADFSLESLYLVPQACFKYLYEINMDSTFFVKMNLIAASIYLKNYSADF